MFFLLKKNLNDLYFQRFHTTKSKKVCNQMQLIMHANSTGLSTTENNPAGTCNQKVEIVEMI
ncbi:unnamed protein product [Paramecium primaurelia]|uniref:Uncharacterized protein n=1 Tax=Paramecium primaurelia TaxID=5886 RepID=A0A8S1QUU0_PARPR|nr:unnamed protein product [Paramecium primaurelia]